LDCWWGVVEAGVIGVVGEGEVDGTVEVGADVVVGGEVVGAGVGEGASSFVPKQYMYSPEPT